MRVLAILAAIATAGPTLPGAQAFPRAEVVVAATYPNQYVAREVVVPQGFALRFVEADSVLHDLESDDRDDEGRPLFTTNGPVPLGESAMVKGVERLEPGPYLFLCNLHEAMTGRLVVLPIG